MKYVKIRLNNPFQKAVGFGETAKRKEIIILKNHRVSSMSIEMAHTHTHDTKFIQLKAIFVYNFIKITIILSKLDEVFHSSSLLCHFQTLTTSQLALDTCLYWL